MVSAVRAWARRTVRVLTIGAIPVMFRVLREACGTCPVEIDSRPTDPEILDWFARVRDYGKARGDYLTKDCIIGWAHTVIRDHSSLEHALEFLREHAPADDGLTRPGDGDGDGHLPR